MTCSPFFSIRRSNKGFTLLEVMVALIIGTLIIGGVMGLISSSLQFSYRVREKSAILPVLEAAAEQVLAEPRLIERGNLKMEGFPDAPVVDIASAPIEDVGHRFGQDKKKQLFRVQLRYMGQLIEFSLVVPEQHFK